MKHSTLVAAAASLLFAQAALAVPSVTIVDTYEGSDSNGYGDVIGNTNRFDIHSMEVQLNGSLLTVSINTAFAGRNDDGSFASYTNTVYGQGQGIGYGDLFLSDSWDPFGTAPYVLDDNTNGTAWSYGFSLGNDLTAAYDRWDLNGEGTLYALNTDESNDHNALLSDDFMSGAIFRNGQEVAVDTEADGVTAVGSGSWTTGSGDVTFLIDLTGTDLLNSDEIAIHWNMTCGNDTIEGSYAVPSPSLLMLLASGLPLLGLAGFLRRKS